MKVLLQRVAEASVTVNDETVGKIGAGLLLLVGVSKTDGPAQADILAQKCAELRIFADVEGKMNLSAKDIGGEALVVSQFTLYGDCHKGRRPNFMAAASGEMAESIYQHFARALRAHLPKVETGIFGAMMKVNLINDGPVTFILERERKEEFSGAGSTEQ